LEVTVLRSKLCGLGLVAALVFVGATEARAQVPTPPPTAPPPGPGDQSPVDPPTNIMFGYQYFHDFSWNENMVLGWSASLTQRIRGNISMVGEASGSHGEHLNTGFTIQRYAFLGGVKVSGGEGQVKPFFQILGGLSRQGGDVGVLNAPAIQAGGGADFTLNDRWTLRGQGDFRFIYEQSELRTAYRVTGGLVIFLGKRQ
jgi:hypothetical protein